MKIVADKYGIELNVCGCEGDYSHLGVKNNGCISLGYLQNLIGEELKIGDDNSGRSGCKCVEVVDIGTYNVCSHNCLYCYANGTKAEMDYKLADYNPESPALCGRVKSSQTIKLFSKSYSNITGQRQIF